MKCSKCQSRVTKNRSIDEITDFGQGTDNSGA